MSYLRKQISKKVVSLSFFDIFEKIDVFKFKTPTPSSFDFFVNEVSAEIPFLIYIVFKLKMVANYAFKNNILFFCPFTCTAINGRKITIKGLLQFHS